MEVSRAGQSLGNLVFEVYLFLFIYKLYENHCPENTENIISLCKGENEEQLSYKGSRFETGLPGFAIKGGSISDIGCRSADGLRLNDEQLHHMRHHKRGLLTMAGDGEDKNGSEFFITLKASTFWDGQRTIVGELVEGESVLAQLEESLGRDGKINGNFRIESSGTL